MISKLGSRQLDSITPPVLIKLLEPVEAAGKLSTVKRLLMRVREIYDLAVNAGFIKRIRSPKLRGFSSAGGEAHARA